MSDKPFIRKVNDKFVVSIPAIIGRIRRRLAKLVPYREMYWVNTKKLSDYYIRIVDPNDPQNMVPLGPYHFFYLVELAKHLDAIKKEELYFEPISIITSEGRIVEPQPLPEELAFKVVTRSMHTVIAKTNSLMTVESTTAFLRAKGYTVEAPDYSDQPPEDYTLS